jgi:hypothetical protein
MLLNGPVVASDEFHSLDGEAVKQKAALKGVFPVTVDLIVDEISYTSIYACRVRCCRAAPFMACT